MLVVENVADGVHDQAETDRNEVADTDVDLSRLPLALGVEVAVLLSSVAECSLVGVWVPLNTLRDRLNSSVTVSDMLNPVVRVGAVLLTLSVKVGVSLNSPVNEVLSVWLSVVLKLSLPATVILLLTVYSPVSVTL